MFNNSLFWIVLFLIVGAIIIFFASRQFLSKIDAGEYEDNEDVEIGDDFPSDILNVPGRQYLFFSYDTRIVSKMYEEDDIEFLEPFISNNHFCIYTNGRVVEVADDRIIAIVHTACLPK